MRQRRMEVCLAVGAMLLLAVPAAAAETQGAPTSDASSRLMPDHGPVGWTWRYAGSVVEDGWGIVSAPARWRGREWAEAGGVVAVGVGLYAADQEIRDWVQDHRNATTDRISSAVRPFGRDYLWYGEGAFIVGSFVIPDRRVTRTALLALENELFAESIGYGTIQLLTNRKRPYQGEGRDAWDGPRMNSADHSFPSGHTTKAWAALTIVASEWSDVPGVAPAAYGLATLVGLSRINDDSHWASDVFAGACLGYFMGKGIEAMHPRDGAAPRARIAPLIDRDVRGIAVAYDW